ncbi:hypothetical protein IQ235_03695 [Oscillatoriales cyanobacterium LEGE 11467]|uniref:Uncharacterized protein n=1 Tax=Zarconia navalis LEGE 11467 TaxID=1828826 RepID=A0A928Z7W2_9CYAN|nr:hypothetical protein [Zarconia navalis]MBE9039894.1 hypothetical protein [Zarconia navalis LEGE 11467]
MNRIKTLLLAVSWLCAFYYLSYPNSFTPLDERSQGTLDLYQQLTSRSR